MRTILEFLNGKKSTICAVLSLTAMFLVKENYIGENWGLLIQGIISILTGGAVAASYKLGIR